MKNKKVSLIIFTTFLSASALAATVTCPESIDCTSGKCPLTIRNSDGISWNVKDSQEIKPMVYKFSGARAYKKPNFYPGQCFYTTDGNVNNHSWVHYESNTPLGYGNGNWSSFAEGMQCISPLNSNACQFK